MFNNQLTGQLKLKIADIIIEARCADPGIGLATSEGIQSFLVIDGKPDCVLDVHYGFLPNIETERKLFDCGDGAWTLYSSGDKFVFHLLAGHDNPQPYRLALFEPGFERGELFILPRCQLPFTYSPISPEEEKIALDPFVYPLDELLVVNLLAQGRGLHTHALGIVHEGRGLVFCGISGAGKSTLAELWKKRQVKVLSDDRISLRKQDGRVWAYGTPWHGDARISLPEKAPLEALYFIEHGPENRIRTLSAMEIATRLMVRCFPTFYLHQGMDYTLNFISDFVQEMPCYELQFTPDESVIDEVLNHVERRMSEKR